MNNQTNNQPIKFVNPKNDVAFKKIFGSEEKSEVLIGFLNAVMDLQGDDAIQRISIHNPYQSLKLQIEKQTILDIIATDNRGFKFIVEMQVANVESVLKRFSFYVAREFAGQIETGEEYRKLVPVVFIGVLDFKLFIPPKEKNGVKLKPEELQSIEEAIAAKRKHAYLSCHQVLDTETHKQWIQDFTFYYIELPKFQKKENEL
ncbi:MAG: Rpn family recombination-promoting nuclease/putative transposase, partial [Chloroflexota bacterium]